MDYLQGLSDVYIVTVNQLLQWVQDPVSIDDLVDFEPLQCSNTLPDNCPEEDNKNCEYHDNLPNDLDVIFMNVCQGPCPAEYPWTGNPYGEKTRDGENEEFMDDF